MTTHPSTQRTPGSPLDLALTRREEGDLEGAISILKSAIAKDLNDLGLVTTLAKMLGESEQLDKAGQWFRRALELAPDDPDVNFGYGTFLGQSGRFEEARAHLVRAEQALTELLKDGDNGWTFGLMGAVAINHARVECELRQFDEARALLLPWFRFEDTWDGAFDVLGLMIERAELDPDKVLDEGLVSGLIAPPMFEYRLGELFGREPLDLVAIDRLIARADELFEFDWTRATEDLPGLLDDLRVAAQKAMMRGEVAADQLAHVLRLHHPRAEEWAKAEDDGASNHIEDDEEAEADETPEGPPPSMAEWDRVTLAKVMGMLPEREVLFGFLKVGPHAFMASSLRQGPLYIPETLARDVVNVATQALALFKPSRSRRQVPLGAWRLEALGHETFASMMITNPDGWEVAAPILTLLQLHARLLEEPEDPYAPFEVLRVATPDPDEHGVGPSIVSVEARFTVDGFRFKRGAVNPRRARKAKPSTSREREAWLVNATDDIEHFLPPLWVALPTFVHPVAAFELYDQAQNLDEDHAVAKGERGWRAICRWALTTHSTYEHAGLEAKVAELRRASAP